MNEGLIETMEIATGSLHRLAGKLDSAYTRMCAAIEKLEGMQQAIVQASQAIPDQKEIEKRIRDAVEKVGGESEEEPKELWQISFWSIDRGVIINTCESDEPPEVGCRLVIWGQLHIVTGVGTPVAGDGPIKVKVDVKAISGEVQS